MREYREAIQEDHFEISRISVEGWRYAYKGIMPDELLNSLDPNKRAEGRRKYSKENPLSTLVCVEAEKPIGFVDFEKCRDDDCREKVSEIWAIYVLPEFIGKGVGKELFTRTLSELSRKGYEEVTVWVLSKNRLARDFYERQGFTIDGGEKEFNGLPEVRYRRSI